MISRGKLILMADADGATKFSDIEKVEAALCDLSPKPVWLFCFVFLHLLIQDVRHCMENHTKNVSLNVYLGQHGDFLWF